MAEPSKPLPANPGPEVMRDRAVDALPGPNAPARPADVGRNTAATDSRASLGTRIGHERNLAADILSGMA